MAKTILSAMHLIGLISMLLSKNWVAAMWVITSYQWMQRSYK